MMIKAAWCLGDYSYRGDKWPFRVRLALRTSARVERNGGGDQMNRTKARRLLSAACGPALGVLLAVPVGGLLAGAAGADPTCYTGCTSPATGITATSGSGPAVNDGAPTSSPSGLAFTGADIEEM